MQEYRKREPCGSCTVVACQLVKTWTRFPFRWEWPKQDPPSPTCSQKIQILSKPSLYRGCWGDDVGLQKVVFIVWRRLMLHNYTSILLSFHCGGNISVLNISVIQFSPCAALWRTPYKLSVLSHHPRSAPYWCNRRHHFKQIVEVRTENQEDVTMSQIG